MLSPPSGFNHRHYSCNYTAKTLHSKTLHSQLQSIVQDFLKTANLNRKLIQCLISRKRWFWRLEILTHGRTHSKHVCGTTAPLASTVKLQTCKKKNYVYVIWQWIDKKKKYVYAIWQWMLEVPWCILIHIHIHIHICVSIADECQYACMSVCVAMGVSNINTLYSHPLNSFILTLPPFLTRARTRSRFLSFSHSLSPPPPSLLLNPPPPSLLHTRHSRRRSYLKIFGIP